MKFIVITSDDANIDFADVDVEPNENDLREEFAIGDDAEYILLTEDGFPTVHVFVNDDEFSQGTVTFVEAG